MTMEEDRRATGMRRVPVQALVEICGRDVGGAPAFEAEAVDVSGRGMHLRTAYLPDIGDPLVCRFDNGGREIVVEGSVAWRNEAERGGEFGIQFTALDSGSVEALKHLCGIAEENAAHPGAAASAAPAADEGSRVRLHIDGLGAPMKACIRTGTRKQLQVASNLEFLKVGRHLEIEDVNQGDRRGAHIDSVDVVIDPQTRVPQLVVALRYEDAESTPEPAVIDSAPHAAAAAMSAATAATIPAGFAAGAASTDDADDEVDFENHPGDEESGFDPADDEVAEEAQAMRGKLANVAVGAGSAAKRGGVMLAKASAAAAGGVGRFFKGAGSKMIELRKSKATADAPKRTTAPPPSGLLSSAARRLRPQSGVAEASEEQPVAIATNPKRRAKKIAAASALAVLLITVGVIAMRKPSAPPGAEAKAPASVAIAAKGAPGDVKQVDETGNPVEKSDKNDKGAKPGSGTTAEVPLFGPTPMATMEPAPLGPAPGGDDGEDKADSKGEEAQEKAAASAAVDDQSFGDGDTEAKKGSPGDVPPWGKGKMNDPLVHRLRLNKPGAQIQGAVSATGFTVVLPGVKIMESPKSIMSRDKRIAKVKTKNATSGAEVSFQFKDGIPGYRVRLKKDYVEFLISSAEDSADKTASDDGAGKKKHHAKKAHHKAPKKTASIKKGGKKKAKKSG